MMRTDLLLITPPFSQPNTPYPATVFLKGFLKKEGFNVDHADLSLETTLDLFSERRMREIFPLIGEKAKKLSREHKNMLAKQDVYYSLIGKTILFMQGKNDSFSQQICQGILPKGERFKATEGLLGFFKKTDTKAKAKFLATNFIEEIGHLITTHIDKNFGFSRYAEKIGISPHSFAAIEPEIKKNTLVTDLFLKLLDKQINKSNPRSIGFTIPFPGNLLAALKMSSYVKKNYPEIPVIIGGGWVNTELRQLAEPNLFDFADFVCLDSGEHSLGALLKMIVRDKKEIELVKTFFRKNGKVVFANNQCKEKSESQNFSIPDYSGLPLDKYISFSETVNPMHNLWSDGRWNKLMFAHGCYWHKCAFCDTSLDYICKYHPVSTDILCDRIESVIMQTKSNDFHFVDEAAPPKLLKEFAQELIRRKIKIRWWTNIRFESNFTRELCNLLAESGCIAVSGGMEVLSDRLLKKMNKGVTIEQAAEASSNLSKAGIMVHSYLMYGFPTQTVQETIDSLEIVRQFFKNKLIKSAFWHRFALTVHSPIAKNPEKFGIEICHDKSGTFANNEISFMDKSPCDHGRFSFGLRKAVYNYMHKSCINYPMRAWFDFKVPETSIKSTLIEEILNKKEKKGS